MKTGKFFANSYFLSMVSTLFAVVLYSSAANAEEVDANAEIYSAVTLHDYEAKASFHEGAAKESQAKAQEQKQLLEQYKAKSYLYGRQAQDLQGHTHALARKYDKAAKAHAREAALHRERATKLAEDSFCITPAKTERC
jgi:hypothetical protein